MIRYPAFTVDVQRCTGCKTCMTACKDKNDLGPGIRWRRVVEFCGGDWRRQGDGTVTQDVFAYYLSISCNHCQDPICAQSCPTGAMHQDASGIVSVNGERCVGCRYCEWVCPYSAPQYDAGKGRMGKCDFCRDELENGKAPACVTSCPTRALGLQTNDASSHYHNVLMAPLPAPDLTSPNLILEPHRDVRLMNAHDGWIANPEEIRDA